MADTDWTADELASIDRIPRYNTLDPASGGDAYSFGGDGYIDNQMRQTVDALVVARGARRMALSASSAAILAAQEAASAKAERIVAQNAASNAYSSAELAAAKVALAQAEADRAKAQADRAQGYAAGLNLAPITAADFLKFLRAKADGSGSEWVAIDLSAATDMLRVPRTGNPPLSKDDKGKWIDILTGTFTQPFNTAASLGNGWWLRIRNSGTGDITLKPNGSETIDGLASFIMYPGEARLIQCDGTALRSIVMAPGIKEFLSSANFVMPPGYSAVAVDVIGAGGGGAYGSNGFTRGAQGGAGGARDERTLPAPAAGTTVSVEVGAGGVGGAAGVPPQKGGTSNFGNFSFAQGGNPGSSQSTGFGSRSVLGPSALTVTSTGGGLPQENPSYGGGGGPGGGNGAQSSGSPGLSSLRAGGGGGGGGATDGNGNLQGTGGRGGDSGTFDGSFGLGGSGGSFVGSGPAGSGSTGTAGANGRAGSGGGGGGYSNNGTGGTGGSGGFPGGGGGGGGNAAGTPGNGGPGAAGRVTVRMI